MGQNKLLAQMTYMAFWEVVLHKKWHHDTFWNAAGMDALDKNSVSDVQYVSN